MFEFDFEALDRLVVSSVVSSRDGGDGSMASSVASTVDTCGSSTCSDSSSMFASDDEQQEGGQEGQRDEGNEGGGPEEAQGMVLGSLTRQARALQNEEELAVKRATRNQAETMAAMLIQSHIRGQATRRRVVETQQALCLESESEREMESGKNQSV